MVYDSVRDIGCARTGIFTPINSEDKLTEAQLTGLKDLGVTEQKVNALNDVGFTDEQIVTLGQIAVLDDLGVENEQLIALLEQKRTNRDFMGVNLIAAAVAFILGMVGLGIAVAFGIGFSRALKDESKSLIEEFKKNW